MSTLEQAHAYLADRHSGSIPLVRWAAVDEHAAVSQCSVHQSAGSTEQGNNAAHVQTNPGTARCTIMHTFLHCI